MKVLIFGATSAIAQAVIKEYAKLGSELFLVAKNSEHLTQLVENSKVLGASHVASLALDLVADFALLSKEVRTIVAKSEFDLVLLAHGTLMDKDIVSDDPQAALSEINANFLSQVVILTEIGKNFASKGSGTIACITSVAGDRGRKSNYVYGSAKGGLSIFLQGLRNSLHAKGVHVLTIKPGFVDTPMTESMKKGLLFVTPEKIAKDIVRAVSTKKNVLYTPFFWSPIMFIIRSIPEMIFKRLSI